MALTRPYLFVHIPKTAGTSLRLAMERAYGDRVLRDYGSASDATSPSVLEHIHHKKNLEAFSRELERRDVLFLTGHVEYAAYRELFPPERVITFVRDPIARVVSEWHHARRNYGYDRSLGTFASESHNQNRQSRMLEGASLEHIGFAGLSERYRHCLEVLNARFSWNLGYLEANTSPGRSALSGSYPLDDEDRRILVSYNERDFSLYEQVKEAWNVR